MDDLSLGRSWRRRFSSKKNIGLGLFMFPQNRGSFFELPVLHQPANQFFPRIFKLLVFLYQIITDLKSDFFFAGVIHCQSDFRLCTHFDSCRETEWISDNGRVLGFETEFYRKDQSRIWVELNAHAIFDDNGRLSAIEGFMVDITERKMMDMELRQAKTQLELRVRERTHDLEVKTSKLERMNRLFIDRELRMKEIKNENRMLMEKLAKKQAVP